MMKRVVLAWKHIKQRNGYEGRLILLSLYLERIARIKFPFKILKVFIQRHYLCDISPYSFYNEEAIETCRLPHPFLIIINSATLIGKNSTIYHNVTIGNREGHRENMECRSEHEGAVLGDNVYIGCGSTLLGSIKIGDNVRIGAMSLVLSDVPQNTTVVGICK